MPLPLQPPYFTVAPISGFLGNHRFYRVYILPDELLILDTGPDEGRHLVAVGAALGGAIGGMIGGAIAEARQSKAESIRRMLDGATFDELQLMAQDPGNFRVDTNEVIESSLDPYGFWETLGAREGHAGKLALRLQDSKLKCRLPAFEDMLRAIRELPQVLGDRLAVNAVWDPRKQRFTRHT
jgi:hypothetical protein